jgi:hypothetical protein
VTNNDLAWYNPANKAFDVFGVTNQGGGSQAQIVINWLVKPTISSVSPSNFNADGGTYSIVFSFATPMPPVQNTTTATFTGGAGITIRSNVANYNAAGWLLGFTVTITTSVSATTATSSITATISGSITYLSGTSFVTGNVTYISNQSTAITLTGTGVTTNPTPPGGGGGGGSDPTCPAIDMIVGEGTLVEDVEVGYVLDCLSANFQSLERHATEAFSIAEAECIRFVAANGAEVIVSTTTPVPTVESVYALREGHSEDALSLFADEIKPGMYLFTLIDGCLETSEAVIVEPVGLRKVGHISVGKRNFAAGVDVRRRIFTHNITVVGK